MKPGLFANEVGRYPRAQTYGVEPASREPASREPGPRHVPAGAVAGSSPLIPPEFYRVKFSTDPEITPSVYNEPRWSVIQTGQAAVITHLNKESVIQVTETYDDDQRGRILGFKARTGEQELREELSKLRKKGLKARAKDLGISDEQIDSAEDEDNPTAAIVELVVTATVATLGVELKDGWVAERGDGYTLAKIADLEIWPRGVPESAESQYDFSGIKFIPEDRPFLMVNDDQLVRVFHDKELERGARLMIGSWTSPDPAERARESIAMNFLYSSNSFMNVSHKQRSHRPEERDEPATRDEATSRYLKYGVTGDIIQIIGKYTPGFNQLGDHTAYEVEYFNAPEYGGLPRPHRCWINAADLLFFTRLDGGDDLGVQDETPFWITARQRAWIYPRYRAKVELLARAAPEISSAQIEQLAVGREFNIDKWVEVPSKGGAPMVKRMRINRNSAWISERNSENGEPFCEKLEPEQVTDADTIGMTYHDPPALQGWGPGWLGSNAESEAVLGPEPAPAPPPEQVEEVEVKVEEGPAEPEEEPKPTRPLAPGLAPAPGKEARISGYVLIKDGEHTESLQYTHTLSEIIIRLPEGDDSSLDESVVIPTITVTGENEWNFSTNEKNTFSKIFVSELKNPESRQFGPGWPGPRTHQQCDLSQLRLDIHYTRGSDEQHTKLVIAVEDEKQKTDFLRDFGLVRADIESRPGGGLLVDRISDWGPGKFSADEMCGVGNFFSIPCSVLRLKKGKTGGTFPQIIGARHVGLPLQSNLTIGIGRVIGEDGPVTHGIIHVDNSGQPELITAGDHMFTKIDVRKTDVPRKWDDRSICNHQLKLDITFLDVKNEEQKVKLLIAFAGWGAGEGTRLYPGKDTKPEAAMIAEKNNFLAEIIKLVEKGGHELFTIDKTFGLDDGMGWDTRAFQQYSTTAAGARLGARGGGGKKSTRRSKKRRTKKRRNTKRRTKKRRTKKRRTKKRRNTKRRASKRL